MALCVRIALVDAHSRHHANRDADQSGCLDPDAHGSVKPACRRYDNAYHLIAAHCYVNVHPDANANGHIHAAAKPDAFADGHINANLNPNTRASTGVGALG